MMDHQARDTPLLTDTLDGEGWVDHRQCHARARGRAILAGKRTRLNEASGLAEGKFEAVGRGL